jgi:hypothetical protein
MRDHTNETIAILAGIGIGAAVMFFLDPHRNDRRRVHTNGDSPPPLRAVRDIEDSRMEADSEARIAEVPVAQMR